MDKLIQTIQDEINKLMTSQYAKLSDAQLARKEKLSIPYSVVMEMYNDYINKDLSMPQLADRYNMSSAVIQKCFKRYKLNARPRSKFKGVEEQQLEDLRNGMGMNDFTSKYQCSREHYFRKKRKVKKDLAD